MFAALTRPRQAATPDEPAAPAAAAPAARDLQDAVRSIGHQASEMGREAAEVRGLLDDSIKASTRTAQTVSALAAQVGEVTRAQDAIAEVSNASLGAVGRARSAVEGVGQEVGGIVATLRQVSEAARTLTQIALQTRLVAFNASVEAKRAGAAGRGFAVVADAVKDLAAQVESSSKQIMGTVGELNGRIAALEREIRLDEAAGGTERGAFHLALADVQQAVASVIARTDSSRSTCHALDAQMAEVSREITQTGRTLDGAMRRGEAFLKISEELLELTANCGIETEDTPYIRGAQGAAGQISRLLEDALRTRAISAADLFDENYRPIANTNPQQHTTRFVELADRLFPQVQERTLALSDKVVYCIAVDRNGYVPTHNQKYCLPQRGDLVWDTANSRYRRIFNDRTGLASARNTRPFLLQTYRRDMGGGSFIVMKEAAAPIVVDGRHWGGLRLAFKF
jgi:methyl-accepting chemotaxis protein